MLVRASSGSGGGGSVYSLSNAKVVGKSTGLPATFNVGAEKADYMSIVNMTNYASLNVGDTVDLCDSSQLPNPNGIGHIVHIDGNSMEYVGNTSNWTASYSSGSLTLSISGGGSGLNLLLLRVG